MNTSSGLWPSVSGNKNIWSIHEDHQPFKPSESVHQEGAIHHISSGRDFGNSNCSNSKIITLIKIQIPEKKYFIDCREWRHLKWQQSSSSRSSASSPHSLREETRGSCLNQSQVSIQSARRQCFHQSEASLPAPESWRWLWTTHQPWSSSAALSTTSLPSSWGAGENDNICSRWEFNH